MSDRSSAGAGAERSLGGRVKRTVQSKVLVPLAATVVSAGVSYLAKKLPLIIEEKLVPKLREKGAPELAKKVEAAGAVLPGTASSSGGADEPQHPQQESGPEASGASNDEREAERRQREKRRQERKRALSSA